MTTMAERRFKSVVTLMITEGIHPTPTRITMQLVARGSRHYGAPNNLSGEECQWLRQDLRVPAMRRGYPYSAPCPWLCCTKGGGIPVDTSTVQPKQEPVRAPATTQEG